MKKIKIGDVIVIILILLITVGVFAFRLFGFDEGSMVSITVDGRTTTYSIDDDREVPIENNGIALLVVIKDGRAYVEASDCPERACIKRGKISKTGDTIVCVPAEVYIKIVGEGDGGYDYLLG